MGSEKKKRIDSLKFPIGFCRGMPGQWSHRMTQIYCRNVITNYQQMRCPSTRSVSHSDIQFRFYRWIEPHPLPHPYVQVKPSSNRQNVTAHYTALVKWQVHRAESEYPTHSNHFRMSINPFSKKIDHQIVYPSIHPWTTVT